MKWWEIPWRSNAHLKILLLQKQNKKWNEMKMIKLHINPGIKEAEIIERSGIKWIERKLCCLPIFRLPQTGFSIRRVASYHLGAENSRQLFTDKFNLHLQYCMLGISAMFNKSCGGPRSLTQGISGFWGIFPSSLLKWDRPYACGLPWMG